MDAIADELDIQVGQNDLTERLVLMSRQYGIEPQQLLQVPAAEQPAAGDVRRRAARPDRRRRRATAATVTDTDGNVIDTDRVLRPAAGADAATPRHRSPQVEAAGEAADAEADEADDEAAPTPK